jgi:hypothetical protein
MRNTQDSQSKGRKEGRKERRKEGKKAFHYQEIGTILRYLTAILKGGEEKGRDLKG